MHWHFQNLNLLEIYLNINLLLHELNKAHFFKDSLTNELSDYRPKFAELIGPWTNDPPNKKINFGRPLPYGNAMR